MMGLDELSQVLPRIQAMRAYAATMAEQRLIGPSLGALGDANGASVRLILRSEVAHIVAPKLKDGPQDSGRYPFFEERLVMDVAVKYSLRELVHVSLRDLVILPKGR